MQGADTFTCLDHFRYTKAAHSTKNQSKLSILTWPSVTLSAVSRTSCQSPKACISIVTRSHVCTICCCSPISSSDRQHLQGVGASFTVCVLELLNAQRSFVVVRVKRTFGVRYSASAASIADSFEEFSRLQASKGCDRKQCH